MVRRLLVTLIVVFVIGASSAQATTINYSTFDFGGGFWEYQYEVVNDTLAFPVEDFTIYFDYGPYSNMGIPLPSPTPDWGQITLDPSLVLGALVPGYYDALTSGGGIPVGGSESGFTVVFDWLGSGVPGSQYFEIVEFTDEGVNVLDSGQTTVAAVPEPSMLLLLASGCPLLIIPRRKLLI